VEKQPFSAREGVVERASTKRGGAVTAALMLLVGVGIGALGALVYHDLIDR
jgi:hypothetical protein